MPEPVRNRTAMRRPTASTCCDGCDASDPSRLQKALEATGVRPHGHTAVVEASPERSERSFPSPGAAAGPRHRLNALHLNLGTATPFNECRAKPARNRPVKPKVEVETTAQGRFVVVATEPCSTGTFGRRSFSDAWSDGRGSMAARRRRFFCSASRRSEADSTGIQPLQDSAHHHQRPPNSGDRRSHDASKPRPELRGGLHRRHHGRELRPSQRLGTSRAPPSEESARPDATGWSLSSK